MRPRKKVLIVTSDPVKSSLVRFQTDLWGFAPMTAADPATARIALRQYEIDVMLLLCVDGAKDLIATVQDDHPFTSVVTLGLPRDEFSRADMQLSASATAAQIKETLRQASCRKRGPSVARMAARQAQEGVTA